MKFITIFIAFFATTACAHKKEKKIESIKKTVSCAQDEAQVLKELVAECKAKFEAEIKRFKKEKCKKKIEKQRLYKIGKRKRLLIINSLKVM